MIVPSKGNLLEARADALVNTVNCVGYMGKGIALQFKQAFPTNFEAYRRACDAGQVEPGRMLVHATGQLTLPRYIINFPTKRHWRGRSRLEDIKAGLPALIHEIQRLSIRSVAVPPLGCGNGGLAWADVKPLIEEAFAKVPEVEVLLYSPGATPPAREMPIGTERPQMTAARALFVKLMERYSGFAYRLTLLEIQKLAYFLQEAGEDLRLRYEAAYYGPYAQNLNKLLERIEGHYIRGYGDTQKPDVEIDLVDGAVAQADTFLIGRTESHARLERVANLIDGFETPYGMELLATVHWVAARAEKRATNSEEAVHAVGRWSERKRKMFPAEHVALAWRRLSETGWIAPA